MFLIACFSRLQDPSQVQVNAATASEEALSSSSDPKGILYQKTCIFSYVIFIANAIDFYDPFLLDVIPALRQQIEMVFQHDPFVISQMGSNGTVPLSVIQQVC